MQDEDRTFKGVLTGIMGLLLLIAVMVSVRYGNIFVFLGILVPILIFVTIYLLIAGMKKKITRSLETQFGDDVMIVATAFMNFFEVPLTVIVGVSLILFVLSISLLIFFSFVYPSLVNIL